MGRLDEVQEESTAMALSEIRTQLQELTKSVESCQSEVRLNNKIPRKFQNYFITMQQISWKLILREWQVVGMKGEMESFKHEMSMVHHVKDDMDELRDAVERMEDVCRRRKNHLLQQANHIQKIENFYFYIIFHSNIISKYFLTYFVFILAHKKNFKKWM